MGLGLFLVEVSEANEGGDCPSAQCDLQFLYLDDFSGVVVEGVELLPEFFLWIGFYDLLQVVVLEL